MSKIYHLSRPGLRLVHKIRHRRGHGIHSPFVFYLITKVIEEKAGYYAYGDILRLLKEHCSSKIKGQRINKLAFRLVNYFGAKNILEIASGVGITSLYLCASSQAIKCNVIELSSKKREKAKKLYQISGHNITTWDEDLPHLEDKQDCIFVDLTNYNFQKEAFISYLLNLVTEHSFIILKGIRTNKASRTLWKDLRKENKVGITLDLFYLGIVFFDKKYHKRNYKINF